MTSLHNTREGGIKMNVIHSLNDKRRKKQVDYELKVLKELSLNKIKEKVIAHFSFLFQSGALYKSVVEDGCIDYAIESYLLGAKYSRFGYLGESLEKVKRRSQEEKEEIIHSLFDYLLCWGKATSDDLVNESIFILSEQFVHSWWTEGYTIGKKRRKLKLH